MGEIGVGEYAHGIFFGGGDEFVVGWQFVEETGDVFHVRGREIVVVGEAFELDLGFVGAEEGDKWLGVGHSGDDEDRRVGFLAGKGRDVNGIFREYGDELTGGVARGVEFLEGEEL